MKQRKPYSTEYVEEPLYNTTYVEMPVDPVELIKEVPLEDYHVNALNTYANLLVHTKNFIDLKLGLDHTVTDGDIAIVAARLLEITESWDDE